MKTLAEVEMPGRIARLPRDRHGYPIPWFVATLDDGTRDFRVADAARRVEAVRLRLCWVCGGALGGNLGFLIGPMCAVNRITAEPPCHRDCALYSVQVCPFLSNPHFVRRPAPMPDGTVPPPGIGLSRNPGVMVLWMARSYGRFRVDDGWLISLDRPTSVTWWREGRPASRAEAVASVESGLPALQDACLLDDDPAASRRALDAQVSAALHLLPAA